MFPATQPSSLDRRASAHEGSMESAAASSAPSSADLLSADLLSSGPILATIDNYTGSIVDVEQNLTVDAAMLARGRRSLLDKLKAEGLAAGDRAIVAISNGPLFVAALDAVLRAGASPLLVHYQLPAAEILRTAERYGAAQVLTDGGETERLAEHASRTARHDLGWGHCDQLLLRALGSSTQSDIPRLPPSPLHPTSGSTGQAKIAVRPGPCAIAEAVNYIGATDISHRDGVLVVTPMSHAYGYGLGMMTPLVSGARILSLKKFTPQVALQTLASGKATVFPAVPAILDMLMLGDGAELLAKPRLVLSAGAPLSRKTVEKFQRVTGRLISPLYGTTETGGITVGTRGATPDRYQSVGPPLAGVQVQLAPTESPEMGAGVGRVMIRSTSMMAGYLCAQGLDRSVLGDGWFLTGDVGRMNPDGEVELLGRESEVINVAGLKVVPSDVEEVLAQYPGMKECKVYAGNGITGNQFVKAAVVTEGAFDEAKLRQYCGEQLAFYKQPVKFFRLDALPRNAAGKIVKNQLP